MRPIKSMVLTMAGITIIGMPLLAWIIMGFYPDTHFFEYMIGTGDIWLHLALGVGGGLIFALIASWITERPFMREVTLRYNQMLGSLRLNKSEVIFISFCAGVGEEFLFRGTMQPLMGIVPTAVIFVALHGYLSFRDWRISVYGLYMTLVIITLGIFTDKWGILSAMIAHTIIDIVLLRKINQQSAKFYQKVFQSEEEEDHE